jgi:hypothetical protein
MLRRVALVRTNVSEEGDTYGVRWLLVRANVVSSSPILVTLMMVAIGSTEKSVLTRATRQNIQEDGILHSHCHENLKSSIFLRFKHQRQKHFGSIGILFCRNSAFMSFIHQR